MPTPFFFDIQSSPTKTNELDFFDIILPNLDLVLTYI